MPTSTLNGMDLTNLGPMTTTWTAPSSCTTGIRLAGVALTEVPHPPQFYELCDFDDWEGAPRYGNCLPDGEEIDEQIRSKTDSGNPHSFVNYYSPGLHCPASWTTAGIAEKGDDGSISATGVFSMTEFTVRVRPGTTEVEPIPTSDPWPNKLAQALHEGETVVACCPSGYTVWEYGACYSNFPIESIQSSTLCAPIHSQWGVDVPNTFTYVNEVITGTDHSATGTSPPEIAFTRTLVFGEETSEPGDDLEDIEYASSTLYTGHTQIPMVLLVRGGDDDDNGSDNSGGDGDGDGDGDGNGDGNGNGDGDNGNAAPGGRATIGASLLTLATVWGVAGLLGAVFMAPV